LASVEKVGISPVASYRRSLFDLAGISATASLIWFSFPGGDAPWLAWLALVPLGLILHGRSAREAFALTTSAWLSVWLLTTWWLVPGLVEITGMRINVVLALYFFFCLFQALAYGVVGVIYSRLGWSIGRYGAFKAAVLWTAAGALMPQILPGNIAHSQYLYPRVIQVADLGGQSLLLFIMYWFAFLLVTGVMRWWATEQSNSVAKPLLLASLLPVLLLVYGGWRMDQIQMQDRSPDRPRVKVGWVQGHLSANRRSRRQWELVAGEMVAATEALIKARPGLDVIIWPEIPPPISYSHYPHDRQLLDALLDRHGVPLLIAAFNSPPEQATASDAGYYNVAEFVTPAGLAGVYTKRRLLPFAEYLPGEDIWPGLRQLFPGALHYLPGKASQVFNLNGQVGLIPMICYEAFFPWIAKEGIALGGNVLINQADDVWFESPRGEQTQLALSMFRAVEYRIPLIRVANSGQSAVVSAAGVITAGPNELAFQSATVVPSHTHSVYYSLTGVLPWLIGGLGLLCLFGNRLGAGMGRLVVWWRS